MISVPLEFFGVPVGIALVDNSLNLSPDLKWRPVLPNRVQKQKHQPHVLVAMLREDAELLRDCFVITTLTTSTGPVAINLNRVVLRPEVLPWLNEIPTHFRINPRKEKLIYDVTQTVRSCGRVVHVNSDKSDCRAENLREIPKEF